MDDISRISGWSGMSAISSPTFQLGRKTSDSAAGSNVSVGSRSSRSLPDTCSIGFGGKSADSQHATHFSGSKRWLPPPHAAEDSASHHGGSNRCATPTQPHFGFDLARDSSERKGDLYNIAGSQVSSARTSSPRPLLASVLEEKNAKLLEELERIQSQTKVVQAETNTCVAGLPAIKTAIEDTTEFLKTAQVELGYFEAEISKRSAKKQITARSSFSTETKHAEQQMQEHVRLQQIADILESRYFGWQQQCQTETHYALTRLEKARFKLGQDIDRLEHEANHYSRALQDQIERENILRTIDEQRCQRFQHKLQEFAQEQQEAKLKDYLGDAMIAQTSWQSQRKLLLQDISHLETHTAEVHVGTAQLQRSLAELEQNDEARISVAGRSPEESLAILNSETHEMQVLIDVLTQKANAAEQEVVDLRDQQRALEKRSMNLIRMEWEECAELEARSQGHTRAPRSLAEDSGLDQEGRVVGEAARSAREELHEAQSQAQRAEQGLREALLELQQQQDMLGHQLQSLQHAPTS